MFNWLRGKTPSTPAEHPLVQDPEGWIYKSTPAFVLGFGAVILGVWAEFYSEHLKVSITSAATNVAAAYHMWSPRPLWVPPDIPTVLFVICLFGYAVILSKRLRADDEQQKQRALRLLRALFLLPDVGVVQQYPEDYWPKFAAALSDSWPTPEQPPLERQRAIAAAIRNALAIIARMAHQFGRGEKARYGANIMLISKRADDAMPPFPAPLIDALRFHSPGALDELVGMLYLPGELLVKSLPGTDPRDIPLISLPIPVAEQDEYGHRLAIPGAPTAVLTGEYSVHEDTRLIAAECDDFSAAIRREIRDYFSPTGDGRDVRSFASVRLGDDIDPFGVLNIDSDHPNVLGVDDDFISHFTLWSGPCSMPYGRPSPST
jgi:hypothetical protein